MNDIAKISLSIEFDNKEWKPIKIETETSDKFAYMIYRKIMPKKADYKEPEKTSAPE